MKNKNLTLCALLSALSIVFGYVESLFPLPWFGAKLGISNIVILSSVYILPTPFAWVIMIIKTLMSSLLFSGISAFIYSLFGGILSVLFMQITKKTNKFSIVGVSVVGAVFHNIGQLFAAKLILPDVNIFVYVPLFTIFGIGFGFVIGVLVNIILPRIKIIKSKQL